MKIAEIITESFVKPQLDVEWDEAKRYPEFRKIGKEAWIELASKGKAVTITDASDINNTDAADPASFKTLDPAKQKRAIAQVTGGKVELPIVAVYSDGYKELIGGNTRLTAMMAKHGKGIVWQFEVPDEVAEFAEDLTELTDRDREEIARRREANLYRRGKLPKVTDIAKNKLSPPQHDDHHKLEFNDILKYRGKYYWRPVNGPQTNHRDGTYTFGLVSLDDAVINNGRLTGMWKQIHSDTFSKEDVITQEHPAYEKLIAPVAAFTTMGGRRVNTRKKFESNSAFDENFKDGKVKGKSRPGRVKRAGASCKGSVSSLRAKAKKYGGEKGKMYHWCANMKGGKK